MCERKQVRKLDALPSRARLTEQEKLLIEIQGTTDATHACGSCGYAWIEIDALYSDRLPLSAS